MQIERFSFREFNDGPAQPRSGAKPFLPTGRIREEVPPPPPPPPTFSEEELKAAERESYRKGFLEGVQEGQKQAESEQAALDRQLAEKIEHFANAVAPLFTASRDMIVRMQQDMPRVALAIAQKVAGHALTANAPALVSEIAARACETVWNEPKITITVHEDLAATVEHKLQQIASRLPAATDIVILRSPEMPMADCRIEWAQGGMERNTEQLWLQVGKMVESMIAAGTRDAQEHMDRLWSGAGAPAQPKETP